MGIILWIDIGALAYGCSTMKYLKKIIGRKETGYMYEITYTCKNEGFIHKLRCALILNGLMRAYDDVELKIKRYDYDAVEELVKEKWKPFPVRDYMKLDFQKGRKVLVSVTGTYMNERELAERIRIAMTRVD